MSEYVFFSPIGNTDPITGQHDGAFLHICRHYKPKKVYLYLSKEMYEHHNTDNRYLYSLEELGKLLNHKFEYELIIRENLVDVQLFDFFYSEFEECIKKISQETDAMILFKCFFWNTSDEGGFTNISSFIRAQVYTYSGVDSCETKQ